MVNRFAGAAGAVSVAALLSLAGCATTSGTAATSKVAGFDGARVVNIQPHGTACTSMACEAIGAQWSSARPDSAIVRVAIVNEIVGITGAEFKIGDRVVRPVKLTPLTEFNTQPGSLKESAADFAIGLADVRLIASGQQRVWLRVHTTRGYSDAAIIDGSLDSKAYHALKRFLAEIDTGK